MHAEDGAAVLVVDDSRVSRMMLAALLRELNDPLIEHLGPTAQSAGGSPGKRYRNMAITRLAIWFEDLYGERPTPTPSGRFAQFCELILVAIGLDTEGLESAIARQLARQRG